MTKKEDTFAVGSTVPGGSSADAATVDSDADAATIDSDADAATIDSDADAATIDSDGVAETVAAAGDDTLYAAEAAAMPPAEPASSPGLRESRYELGEQIARGGMGRIIAANDRQFDRPVAIKELLPQYRDELRERFRREALITGRLQHPAIVPVYELGTRVGGEPYYAMKHVEGKPFDKVIAETETLDDRLALLPNVIAVAEAIAYAHSHRIIHRDLKPQNVLIGEYGETVVIDWGLAKHLDADDDIESLPPSLASDSVKTAIGSVMGTPAYMPREQALGKQVDERADVYALGAILYHMLSGDTPVVADSPMEILEIVKHGGPPPLSDAVPDAPPDLISIVAKAMAPEPDDRYASASELAADLKRFRRGQLVSSHDYSPIALVKRWIDKHRAAALIGAIAVVAVASLGTWALVTTRTERDQALSAQMALLQNQGRAELMANRPRQALVYLSRAYTLAAQRGDQRRVLGMLIRDATRRVEPIVTVLSGHGGEIRSVDLSRDGRRALTSSQDGTVRVWDAQTGEQLAVRDLGVPLWDARFGADDATVIGFGESKSAIWDDAGAVLSEISYDREQAKWVELSADEQKWIVVTYTRAAIYNRAGELVAELTGHERQLIAGNLDHDGKRAVTCGRDTTARVWNAETGQQLAVIEAGKVSETEQRIVGRCMFRPGSDQILTSADSRLRIYSTSGGEPRVELAEDRGMSEIEFSDDGKSVLSISPSNDPIVWDAESGKMRATLWGSLGATPAAVFSDSGKRVIAGGTDGVIKVWDASSGELLSSLYAHDRGVRFIAEAREGEIVASVGYQGWTATITRPGQGALVRVLAAPAGDQIMSIELDRAHKRLFTRGRFEHAIWDVETGKRTALHAPGQWIGGMARISPDGSMIAGASFNPKQTSVTPTKVLSSDGTELASLRTEPPSRVRDIEFSPDSSSLASAHEDGTVRIWEPRSGKEIARLRPTTAHGVAREVEYSPDGSRIGAGYEDGTAIVWSAGGTRVSQLVGRKGATALTQFRWLGNGTRAVIAREGGSVAVVDTATGRAVDERHVGSSIRNISVSDRGDLLAVGGNDWDARLLEIDGLRLRHELRSQDAVSGSLFSPDGSMLITTTTGFPAQVWDVDSGQLIWQRGDVGLRDSREGAFLDDGNLLVTAHFNLLMFWDLRSEQRSPAEIAKLVEDKIPWKLDADGYLRPTR